MSPLTLRAGECNLEYTMTIPQPITEVLRQTIVESGIPLLTIERETGVLRQSLMKFVRARSTIHLDSADALATYFGLELRLAAREATTESAPKRKGT